MPNRPPRCAARRVAFPVGAEYLVVAALSTSTFSLFAIVTPCGWLVVGVSWCYDNATWCSVSHEIHHIIEMYGGAYLKIGLRWYRLEQISEDECREAEETVIERERAALESIGLKGKQS